jgi:hypothetical protein
MRIAEISIPQMVKLHYFNVDDEQIARELGFRQDRNGRWYLPQYNTSASGFDRNYTSAVRSFNRPIRVVDLIK